MPANIPPIHNSPDFIHATRERVTATMLEADPNAFQHQPAIAARELAVAAVINAVESIWALANVAHCNHCGAGVIALALDTIGYMQLEPVHEQTSTVEVHVVNIAEDLEKLFRDLEGFDENDSTKH